MNKTIPPYAFYDAASDTIDIVPNGQKYRRIGINKAHEAAKVMREWMVAGIVGYGVIRSIDGSHWNEQMNLAANQ